MDSDENGEQTLIPNITITEVIDDVMAKTFRDKNDTVMSDSVHMAFHI